MIAAEAADWGDAGGRDAGELGVHHRGHLDRAGAAGGARHALERLRRGSGHGADAHGVGELERQWYAEDTDWRESVGGQIGFGQFVRDSQWVKEGQWPRPNTRTDEIVVGGCTYHVKVLCQGGIAMLLEDAGLRLADLAGEGGACPAIPAVGPSVPVERPARSAVVAIFPLNRWFSGGS